MASSLPASRSRSLQSCKGWARSSVRPSSRTHSSKRSRHDMIMVADALRLTLFPAMMAFAASSDLLTMTISNRVSLILVGGFAALAAIGGVSAADVLSHLAAGCVVLVAAFSLFARGIIGGGDAKLAAATALWHCPCRRGACRLSGHAMDGDRNVIARVPSAAISHRSTDC